MANSGQNTFKILHLLHSDSQFKHSLPCKVSNLHNKFYKTQLGIFNAPNPSNDKNKMGRMCKPFAKIWQLKFIPDFFCLIALSEYHIHLTVVKLAYEQSTSK